VCPTFLNNGPQLSGAFVGQEVIRSNSARITIASNKFFSQANVSRHIKKAANLIASYRTSKKSCEFVNYV